MRRPASRSRIGKRSACGKLPRRANHFDFAESCQVPKAEIFLFTGILIYGKKQPARAAMRGASRSSRNVVRVAMDACGVSASNRADETLQRTAKSCGPGAATVASIRPDCVGAATVTINAAHRGEHV